MAIYLFFHVYCNENTAGVVVDQIKNIHFSGLYALVDAIYYCLAGDEERRISEIEGIFGRSGAKFRLLRRVPGDRSYERLTLGAIHETVTAADVFCYIHSKGVQTGGEDPRAGNIAHWRQMMEYHLFARYREYLRGLLEGNYDVAGVCFRASPRPHFSGNFWWCRGEYYLGLPRTIDPGDYYAPEMYLFTNLTDNLERSLCLYQDSSARNYYFEPLYFGAYVDAPLSSAGMIGGAPKPIKDDMREFPAPAKENTPKPALAVSRGRVRRGMMFL